MGEPMSVAHKELADGRWQELSFVQQMANIGSEIGRAINWQNKGNPQYARKAVDRALELISLTLAAGNRPACIREVARLKEAVIDYFYGENEFSSSDMLWRKYFDHFNYAARKDH